MKLFNATFSSHKNHCEIFMRDKFRNKYRTKSIRLSSWDYGCNAAYFVTICTHNRECFFGNVVETQDSHENEDAIPNPNIVETQDFASLRDSKNVMELSSMGKIAQSCWLEIPDHFPFVELGEFVIMPNHVHGIIIINKKNDGRNDFDGDMKSDSGTAEMQNRKSLRDGVGKQKPMNKFGPQSKNLASIIRGFKTGVTKKARKIHPDFKWQSRYHDHIIRNEKSFQTISEYIIQNPENWKKDKMYMSK